MQPCPRYGANQIRGSTRSILSEIHEFFRTAAARESFRTALPEGCTIRFQLHGPDGGVWTVKGHGDRVEIEPKHVMWVDCELTCTVEDFFALINGQLTGREGFMAGRFKIRGDVGLILRLEHLLAS